MTPTELEKSLVREKDLERLVKIVMSFLIAAMTLGSGVWACAMWVGGVDSKLQILQQNDEQRKKDYDLLNQKLDKLIERGVDIVPQAGKQHSYLQRNMVSDASAQDAFK